MKIIYLSVIMSLLAACGNGANRAEAEDVLIDSTGISAEDYSEDEEEMFEGGKVYVSEDGRVTIESGVCPNGGTSPDYWAKWTIVNDKGVKHELRFSETSYVGGVHSLKRMTGQPTTSLTARGRHPAPKNMNGWRLTGLSATQ